MVLQVNAVSREVLPALLLPEFACVEKNNEFVGVTTHGLAKSQVFENVPVNPWLAGLLANVFPKLESTSRGGMSLPLALGVRTPSTSPGRDS